jgi:hypothetical protein
VSDALLRWRTPDRDYSPRLVALVAAPLLDSGQTTEDCELAVARAVRLAAMRLRYPTFRECRPLLSLYVRAAASEDKPDIC